MLGGLQLELDGGNDACSSEQQQGAAMARSKQKIFGIGWAKTGTTTLGECCRIMGYRHRTRKFDLVDGLAKGDLSRILAVAGAHDSFDDWPWLLVYRALDEAFPGSKFVLTIRDPEPWVKSYFNMLRNQGEPSPRMNRIRSILYGFPFPDVTPEQLVARYERHNAEVLEYFKDRPGDLLVVDWSKGHGWRELCAFLGHDLPDVPFPQMNKGVYSDKRAA